MIKTILAVFKMHVCLCTYIYISFFRLHHWALCWQVFIVCTSDRTSDVDLLCTLCVCVYFRETYL